MFNHIVKANKINYISIFFILMVLPYSFANAEYYELSSGAKIVDSFENGIIIQFDVPDIKYDTKIVNGRTFQVINFADCGFTNEASKPMIPVQSFLLGMPGSGEASLSVTDKKYSMIDIQHPIQEMIVHNIDVENEESGVDYAISSPVRRTKQDNVLFGSQSTNFYPSEIAVINPIGNIRQQRVAKLEFHPIQYNPSTNKIKVYRSIQVKVIFQSATKNLSQKPSDKMENDDGVYEDIYKESLLNYDQAKKWRISRDSKKLATNKAPGFFEGGLDQRTSSSQYPAYKLTIDKNGIYRLDYSYLVRAGIDPSVIDPRKIELECGGKKVPIYVQGYEDGKFDKEDYIEFYGVKLDSIYTDSNVYWLSWGGLGSWMMAVKDGSVKNDKLPSPAAFLDTQHIEYNREYDPLKRETSETADHFFWRAFRGQDVRNNSNKENPILIDLPYRAPNLISNFKLRVCFNGITFQKGASTHVMKVTLNGELMDTAVWEGQIKYISESTIRQDMIHKTNWLVLECNDNNGTVENPEDSSMPKWDVYLNWVEVDYWREFVADNNRLEFSTETIPSITRSTKFTVNGFTSSNIEIFQIDKFGAIAKIINPDIQNNKGTYTLSYEDDVSQPTRYFATSVSSLMYPKSIAKDEPSTLHDPANRVDYIMITHKNFLSSTERLAEFRRKQGLDVIVVNVEDVYDEFSHGVFDPKAIKRFLGYAYFNWDRIPTYVLLVGDAHWDYKYVYDEYYKKYANYPRIYVPTYHAPSSPYGETAMDHRFVTVSGDDIIPDMIIGRIPAETVADADNAVNKTIEYETKPNLGPWQTRIMLVADDEKSKSGDEVFEDSSKDIANNYIPFGYEAVDIYLRRIGEPYIAQQMIVKNINSGLLTLQYSGHGGAYHWAHEGIFDYRDATKLQNPVYPFVITTTCENGYFDNPQGGNKSLMELFLLNSSHSGAVACLSATRLTYGQGNAVFSKILYPRIFNEKPPIVGKIVNLAKIDFIKLDISAWVSSAEQYTIFGDPATKLALPDMTIDCELAKSSVDASKDIEIKTGSVKRITGNNALITDTEFSSEMRISVVYPNNMDEDNSNDLPVQYENVKVWKGVFSNIKLKIPSGVIPGEGRIRFYAQSGNMSANGGIKFSISKPVIEFSRNSIIDDENLQVYVAIVDNQGDSGIKLVECEWHNTETWKWYNYPMSLGKPPKDAPEIQGSWYILKEYIPLSKPGTRIDYRIRIQDNEGNTVLTELESVKVPIGVNLALTRALVFMSPDISYSYDHIEGSWTLSVPVENNGSKEIKRPVAVYFFEGNPDRDSDNTVDQEAQILATAVINYEQWDSGSAGVPIQKTKAVAKLKEPLYPGFHQIFVWINPKVLHALPGVDKVEDNDETDNRGSKLYQINEYVVGKDKDTLAQSLDGTMKMLIPQGAVGDSVMSITQLGPPESVWTQPDLKLGPVPEYGLDGGTFKILLTSGETVLHKSAQIDIKFDITRLRELAKVAKGLADKETLTYTEQQWVEIAMQEEAKKLAIYSWQEELGVWKNIPSELIKKSTKTDGFAQEYYITLPVTANNSDMLIDSANITIDEVSTPIGNWTIFFLDSERFNVYFRREGMTFYENLGRYGEVGKLYSNTDFGIQIDISDTDSRFGDVHRFDTYRELDGTIRLRNFRNYNDGDGTVRITGIEDESIQTNQTSGEWVIFFLDSKRFEIHGQNGRPLLDDEGLNITGTVGNEISIPSIDAKIEIHDGKYTFHFGDRFTFKTLFTGTVRAQLSQLGTIALMYNSDYASPGIQLWVNGLSPKDSAVIPPRPSISLMLSDANGIDMKSLSFLVSINDRGFHDVPKDDYVVSDRYQLDNVPIFYSPIMDIGKYRYRISVKDFNGNAAKGDQGDFSEFMFLVEEKADLSPPSIDLTVDGQILINQQVLRKSPEFNISISDDHAIDKASISILFGKEGAIEPLKENEYIISLSGDLRSAKIAYTPELINGVYEIQAKANDMSNNTGYLSSPDVGPIKFILDEKVEVKDIINAPNPFSNTTVFSYFLTQPADKVTVKIYTMRGRLIKTIEQDSPSWKYNEEFWDGRDEDGNRLASGVYFYKFIANDKEKRIEKIGKLAIIR